jgi:hypothetical protein
MEHCTCVKLRQAVALVVMSDSHIDLIVVNPAPNGIAEMVQTFLYTG